MENNHIDYIEFKAADLTAVKEFYSHCFGWEFTDYGPDYCSFSNSGISGGFEKSGKPPGNGVLVVLYHKNLQEIKETILQAGGNMVQDIFSFPGGRRFHFRGPCGNELAIWSE
ncbi:MAG: VOC family protein [Robiginitalea sp.]|jgi:predicted enzyme related to lactoylglutathione lyase